MDLTPMTDISQLFTKDEQIFDSEQLFQEGHVAFNQADNSHDDDDDHRFSVLQSYCKRLKEQNRSQQETLVENEETIRGLQLELQDAKNNTQEKNLQLVEMQKHLLSLNLEKEEMLTTSQNEKAFKDKNIKELQEHIIELRCENEDLTKARNNEISKKKAMENYLEDLKSKSELSFHSLQIEHGIEVDFYKERINFLENELFHSRADLEQCIKNFQENKIHWKEMTINDGIVAECIKLTAAIVLFTSANCSQSRPDSVISDGRIFLCTSINSPRKINRPIIFERSLKMEISQSLQNDLLQVVRRTSAKEEIKNLDCKQEKPAAKISMRKIILIYKEKQHPDLHILAVHSYNLREL
ncbi:centriole and centriolar satellite protein ofd1-like [Neocloeon triangulifer]|uniref:centriole and centriolar satellite protein ofd1-like n=1 Tax=Neocloeon triangulifer TaxID=2078957 RepID=UPI00286EF60B|nr:centriole and centriolar satellite protein ofd1-like [Neocloeon triangulifer]